MYPVVSEGNRTLLRLLVNGYAVIYSEKETESLLYYPQRNIKLNGYVHLCDFTLE